MDSFFLYLQIFGLFDLQIKEQQFLFNIFVFYFFVGLNLNMNVNSMDMISGLLVKDLFQFQLCFFQWMYFNFMDNLFSVVFFLEQNFSKYGVIFGGLSIGFLEFYLGVLWKGLQNIDFENDFDVIFGSVFIGFIINIIIQDVNCYFFKSGGKLLDIKLMWFFGFVFYM